MNLSYFSIVCIGGDGTVNQLLNGLLHRTLHYKGVKVTPGTTPPQPPLPMGIIPAGKWLQEPYREIVTGFALEALWKTSKIARFM